MRLNLDGVPPGRVRFWAIVDSVLSFTLAAPPLAERFIAFAYFVNGKLGGTPTVPAFTAFELFFVCLSGTLIALWSLVRYLKPIGLFALLDGWGRVWVSLLIVWFVTVEGAPRVLLLFIVSEIVGAVAQLHEVYRTRPLPRAAFEVA